MREETKIQFSLGKRIVKTGLAAGVAYFITDLLNLDAASMGTIAAVICMQPTIHETLTVSKNRILGSIIGSVVAFAFIKMHVHNPAMLAVGVGLMLYICKIFKWKDAGALASIIFVSIYLSPADIEPVANAIDRLLATFVGIVASLVINYAIPPTHIGSTVENDLKKLFALSIDLFKIALNMVYKNDIDLNEFNGKRVEFIENYEKADKDFKSFEGELQYTKKIDKDSLDSMGNALENFSIAVMYITQIVLDMKTLKQPVLTDDFKYLFFHIISVIDSIEEDMSESDLDGIFKTFYEIADTLKASVDTDSYSAEENAYVFGLISKLFQTMEVLERTVKGDVSEFS